MAQCFSGDIISRSVRKECSNILWKPVIHETVKLNQVLDTVHGLTSASPILSYFSNINPIVSSICTCCLPNYWSHHVFRIKYLCNSQIAIHFIFNTQHILLYLIQMIKISSLNFLHISTIPPYLAWFTSATCPYPYVTNHLNAAH
jgi:hypothetical protein